MSLWLCTFRCVRREKLNYHEPSPLQGSDLLFKPCRWVETHRCITSVLSGLAKSETFCKSTNPSARTPIWIICEKSHLYSSARTHPRISARNLSTPIFENLHLHPSARPPICAYLREIPSASICEPLPAPICENMFCVNRQVPDLRSSA